ncbi:hypothetical protein D3C80_1046580 [compost metagenome]
MTTENGVQERPELHRTATNIQAFDLEGNNPVVSGKVEVLQFHSCFRHHLTPSRRSSRVLSQTFTQTGRQAEPLGRSKVPGTCQLKRLHESTAHLKADRWCRLQANSRPGPVPAQIAPKHQARMDFWAWRRFSASSKTTDCGPSITASVTSSPRWAGRQCMNSASALACFISASLT